MNCKSLTAVLALCAGLAVTSCSTKQSAISDLRSITADLKQNASTYTVDDWRKTATKVEKVAGKLKKSDLTTDEKREVSYLLGQCGAYSINGIKDNVTGKVVDAATMLQGIVSGFTEGLGGSKGTK